MKKITLTFIIALCHASGVLANQEPADTIEMQTLNEVVVEAPKVIHKIDMDVYHPSKSAVENSKNGMTLLRNLMIPTLTVNDALGTISAAGENVQVRINGRKASVNEVKALLPETIKRVEWIDNPGLKYNGASYVLNFIVANPTVGGSLMLHAQPALTEKFGFYQCDAKFNSGRSQWSVGGNFKLTEDIESYRDYKETFTYPDGSSLTRTETPLDGSIDNSQGYAWLSYNYIKPDTTVFYVSLQTNGRFSDKIKYDGQLSLSDGTDDIILENSSGSEGITPSFSAYFEQHLANRQIIAVDFAASYYSGNSFSDYMERLLDSSTPITDIHTYIKDRNQAYGIEANYIKKWNKSRLTVGTSYSANRNRSTYENLDGEIFHQRQDKVYMFTEYFQRIDKFTLTAGIGSQYTAFKFKESGLGNDSWNFRPQATVTFRPIQGHSLRLVFQSWQSTPSLSNTNTVPQQIDGFQWNIGNPDLKTSSSYKLTLQYNYNFPYVSGALGINGFTSPDAITPCMYWDGDRLITTYENSKGLQNVRVYIAPQIDVIPEWVTVSGILKYMAERMTGNNYRHYNHCWSGNVNMLLSHWGFTLALQYQKAQRDLFGEKISWGESLSIIDLQYNWKAWEFGAGVIMPFGKYDQGWSSLCKWNTNEQHSRLNMRIPYVSISYNLQWGRQKRGANKLINADANVEQSKTSAR